MKDKNGVEVQVGQRAVIIAGDFVVEAGSIGSVEALKEDAGARIGTEGDDGWSGWFMSDEFVIMPSGDAGEVGK